MNIKDIQYHYEDEYLETHIFCPHIPLKGEGLNASHRGAKAHYLTLKSEAVDCVRPDVCHECEYKMYRMLGLTCPNEPPPSRRRSNEIL